MSDLYYNPEAYGLEAVSTLEDPNASYSFDTVALWRRIADGKLFWAADSGCSCPTPFDEYDLRNINPLPETERDLRNAIDKEAGWPEGPLYNVAEKRDFMKAAGLR